MTRTSKRHHRCAADTIEVATVDRDEVFASLPRERRWLRIQERAFVRSLKEAA